MTREATVVNTAQGLKAEVVRSEACAQCRACSFGQTERVLCELPRGDYKEGDTVLITISDHALTKATLLAYGVPLVFLLLGLLLGRLLFPSEALQALTAGLCTVLGLIWLALGEKKRRRTKTFECTAHKTEKE